MTPAILLSCHGTVESTDDLPAFLANIRRGRPVPAHLVDEVRRRFEAIGGSPLMRTTRAQAQALADRTGLRVAVAARLWHPYPKEALAELLAEGVRRVVSLPLAPQPTLDSLTAALTAQGLMPTIDFVYAAFDDRTTGGHAVYYHGKVSGTLPQGYRILPLADLAKAPLANPTEAQMLARYADDFRNGSFTLYHGTETSGHVRQIGAR